MNEMDELRIFDTEDAIVLKTDRQILWALKIIAFICIVGGLLCGYFG